MNVSVAAVPDAGLAEGGVRRSVATSRIGQGQSNTGLRGKVAEVGQRWAMSLAGLVRVVVELDDSGEWAFDGSATCAHWVSGALDVEVCTAREWLRVGRAIRAMPLLGELMDRRRLSFTKVRALTRLATVENVAELSVLAERTSAGQMGAVLAAWSLRNEDDETRNRLHRRERGLRYRVEPDGMVTASLRMTPEQFAVLGPVVDAEMKRRDGRDSATPGEIHATRSRGSHDECSRGGSGGGTDGDSGSGDDGTSRPAMGAHANGRPDDVQPVWLSLAQQRIDALIGVLEGHGTTSGVAAEMIVHVRGDGCTLDDGTPISGSVAERIASGAMLRAMIHDAECHPINVSGRHRHHTDRQKRVVKERDRCCVDCGDSDFLEYDHEPDFNQTGRTLVEETKLRCSRCHRARHQHQANGHGAT